MAWLGGLVIIGQVAQGLAIEHGPPSFRDPEYGVRETRLRSLVARNPGSSLCVAFGSSRVAEGLRPAAIERTDPSDAVIFNLGLIGAGPVIQRLALERVLRAGIRPELVLIEFWPPYLYESAAQPEQDRFDRSRLNSADDAAVASFWSPAGNWAETMIPSYSHRFTFLNLLIPNWLPFQNRREFHWNPLDDFGWLPGRAHDKAGRTSRLEQGHQYYAPILQSRSIDPIGVRAFEDLFAVCRERGIEVGVIWLPESSEFRSWYAPTADGLACELFGSLSRRKGIHVIDARAWVADERLGDGFHLDPEGATAFTLRLRNELASLAPKGATP